MPDPVGSPGAPHSAAEVATSTPYSDPYFLDQQDTSSQSADYVVPIVLSLLPVQSMIDVGCGVGTWTAKFLEHGVEDVLGLDGDYVNRQLLGIPPNCLRFIPRR
jgi:predicted RNA methylase